MRQKTRLFLFTFLAVFLSILAMGVVIFPLVIAELENTYFELQADVNERHARAMSRFVQGRLASGAAPDVVLAEFQAAIEGTDTDRGYVCLIDQDSSQYLCHPDLAALGMSAGAKNPLFDEDFDGENLVEWLDPVQSGRSGSGLLVFEELQMREVVFFQAVENANWTVSSHENTARIEAEIASITRLVIIGAIVFAFVVAFPVSFSARRVGAHYERRIENERQRADGLLENILPSQIVPRMKAGESPLVEHFNSVSVLFCDIVDFTPLSRGISPEELVSLLNSVFSSFDQLCDKYGVEKIKTIGDAYMAVAGVPSSMADHGERLGKLAIEMMNAIRGLNGDIRLRIGLHCGEVVAGVIGTRKFSYDLWGNTVNVASRLESSGEPGKIHCSDDFAEANKSSFAFTKRGETPIKGVGSMTTWFLTGMTAS